jgi:hypothetical protein
MLTTQGETSEADILKRISLARGNSEPEPGPTEEPSAVDVSLVEAVTEESEPVDDTDVEAADDTLEDNTLDESADSDAVDDTEELESGAVDSGDDEDLYVEYKGREINLKDVEEWEQGHLRQSDYTRKTQDLAEQRKAFEAEKEAFTEQSSKVQDMAKTLEAIVAEDTLSAEALAEMREYEPEEYIKYQEKMDKRKELLGQLSTSNNQASNVDLEKERQALWDANPAWLDNGKQTEAFTKDMGLIRQYAEDRGFTEEDMSGIQHARVWLAFLDAAKYKEVSKKGAAITKKVRKAPVTTKPKQAAQNSLQREIKEAEARLKQTGRSEDAIKLRQLKRKLNG